ncbi:MAG: lipoate--protein ligase family protein [Planctomycetes bacterium]|nr:lipoate--protein ligase family protein [Planctomycetota bacterium]
MNDARARWRLLRTGACAPAWNLAVDEALLMLAAPGGAPTLRLYGWSPHGLSLGRFQDAATIPREFRPTEPWTLVRRPTGGGAIHHANELTYSVVISSDHALTPRTPMEGYARFHAPLVRALASLGASTRERGEEGAPPLPRPRTFFCFGQSASSDLVTEDGLKILGSAQRRTRRGFLQHGSLPLEGTAGAQRGATSVADACDRIVAFADAEAAIIEAFRAEFGIDFVELALTDAEVQLTRERIRDRYGNDDWTMGGFRSRTAARRTIES